MRVWALVVLAACGTSPAAYIDKRRAEVQPALDTIRAMARDAASHRAGAPRLEPPGRVVFCDMVMRSGLGEEAPCNARVLYLDEITGDPSQVFTPPVDFAIHSGWYRDSAGFLASGNRAASKFGPPTPPVDTDEIARAFDDLLATDAVFVVVPDDTGERRFAADVYAYTSNGRSFGEFAISATGERATYVEAGGAHAGSTAAVVETLGNETRRAFADRVAKLAPAVVFQATIAGM